MAPQLRAPGLRVLEHQIEENACASGIADFIVD